MRPRVLLHACCGPCSIECVRSLREEGFEPTLYWYNPNIRPEAEYGARLSSLRAFAEDAGAPLILGGDYGEPFEFAEGDGRCPSCYSGRLSSAARAAAEGGFPSLCATLLISPYQDHPAVAAVGERAAARFGVEFLYRDFRPLFREGQRRARELGLYRQKYCGCGEK